MRPDMPDVIVRMKPSFGLERGRHPGRPCRGFWHWLLVAVSLSTVSRAEEILYNGIRLPAEWPPRNHE